MKENPYTDTTQVSPRLTIHPVTKVVDLRSEAEQIKERHIAYLTMTSLWLLLLFIALFGGSVVIRACSEILGHG